MSTSAILKIGKDDKDCFLWSILAHIHPCQINHPERISNFLQDFNELDIDGFDFSQRFNCSDVHRFDKFHKLSLKIFEKSFYQV